MTTSYEQLRRHWFVACLARSLRKRPIGVCVLGTPLVVFRAGDVIVAAEDRCPHRNAPLSRGTINGDRIRCPYHGWCFDATGRCVEAPGMSSDNIPPVNLRAWQARELDGLIWVAPLDTPSDRQPYRARLAADANYHGFSLVATLQADLADALENLLDGTHTPFVHAGVVRSATVQQSFTATVRRYDTFVEAEYRGEQRQSGIISRWFEPEREASFGRFVPPCTAELEYRSPRRTELFVAAHFTPSDDNRLQVFVTCYLPQGLLPARLRWAVVKPFFQHVLRQDRRILDLQQWNILRFGRRTYTNWTADVLRPWIDAWMHDGCFPQQSEGPQSVRFLL